MQRLAGQFLDNVPKSLLGPLTDDGKDDPVDVYLIRQIAELLSDAPLREKIKATNDPATLHTLISTWQSAQPA